MKIVADSRIPHVAEAFGPLGELVTLPGREIDRTVLRDADALLTRSVTKVSADLLADTSVRFVGTATIGFDHIDLAYLRENGIGFASSAGCNANAVGQYMTAVLLELAALGDLALTKATLGVVGVGHVGSQVVRYARALGMRVLENDPPRQRAARDDRFVSLDQVCEQSDLITLHVPLTRQGPDATHHLFDADRLGRLSGRTVVVNTSRGPVVDEAALLAELRRDRLLAVVDVWEGEPNINVELLRHPRLRIGTSHVAGYSYEGKITATDMVHEALCHHFGVEGKWDSSPYRRPPDDAVIPRPGDLIDAIRHTYDIRRDHAAMLEMARMPADQRGPGFDRLRNEYDLRREFENYRVLGPADARLGKLLGELGFQV